MQIKPELMTEVYLPIAPQVEQGTITIKIQIHTQMTHDTFDVELEILVIRIQKKNVNNLILFFEIDDVGWGGG